MRCNDCNKFVSFDSESDAEINVTVDDEGVITGDVTFTNNCAECGTELKQGTLDIECDLSQQIVDHRDEKKEAGEPVVDHDTLDVEDDGGQRFDEMQDTDRRGKKIKNVRYMKHLYGVEIEFTVTCKCGETFTQTWRDSLPGSAMEEM